MTLLSKLQYKNYEPGEFTEQQERTYEETIQQVEGFPWEEQRDHWVVSLTNPSITIEGKNGDFLKLALYYNEKFVLYYLDPHHHLYTRSSLHYQDLYPIIRAFFKDDLFAPSELKREHTPLQNNIVHFEDKNFTYRLEPAGILVQPVAIGIIFLMIAIGCLRTYMIQKAAIIFLPLLLVLAIAILVFFIYINHWKHAQGKILKLSRGKDVFFYGPEDAPDQFSKKDILEVVTFGSKGRYGYPRTTMVQIDFKNGHSIEISCLLIRQEELIPKFPGCSLRTQRDFFPLMPPDDPALS